MKALKEVLRIIRARFILLLGVGLFTYGLFSFHADSYCDRGGLPSILPECTNPAVFYYYDNLILTLLVVGALLITVGILKRNSE